MQVAPHIIRGALHAGAQEPITHPSVGAQAWPQTPQFAASERTSRSQPFAGIPSQSPKPTAHVATLHAPAAQYGVASGRLQAAPHALQLPTEVSVLVSQPFAGTLSQSPNPARHRDAHVPRLQYADAFVGAAHVLPQMPQADTSV